MAFLEISFFSTYHRLFQHTMYTTTTMYTTMPIGFGMAQIGVPTPVSLLETGESVKKMLLNGETVRNFLFSGGVLL